MPKSIKGGKAGRPKPSLSALSGFASAKTSTYDKQARKRKERALNSKVVNKYRKLKARLQATGGPVPQSDATPPPRSATADAQQLQQQLQPQIQSQQQQQPLPHDQHDSSSPAGEVPP